MKKVIVYTQPDCPPCEITKLFLTEHQIPFEIKNIKNDKLAMKELVEKYKSYTTPTIVIDDTVITGFDLEKLKQELNIEN